MSNPASTAHSPRGSVEEGFVVVDFNDVFHNNSATVATDEGAEPRVAQAESTAGSSSDTEPAIAERSVQASNDTEQTPEERIRELEEQLRAAELRAKEAESKKQAEEEEEKTLGERAKDAFDGKERKARAWMKKKGWRK